MDVKNVNAKENFLHSIKGKVLFMGGNFYFGVSDFRICRTSLTE